MILAGLGRDAIVVSPVNTHVLVPSNRSAALIGLVVSGAMLTAAARMTPDPRGLGSHEQLGLPPCGMFTAWKLPCPTCGMCTSFALGVRGKFISAFHAQPAGLGLFVATAVCCALCVRVLVIGRALRLPIPLWPLQRWVILVASVLLFGWAYKCLVVVMSRANH